MTTVCPGLMRTGSARNADFKGQHQAEYAWFSISGAPPLLSMGDPSADATAHQFGAELLHHAVGMVLGELARQRHTARVRARLRRVG